MVKQGLSILMLMGSMLVLAGLAASRTEARSQRIPIQPVTPGTMELMRDLSSQVESMETEIERVSNQLKNMWETFQEHGCEQSGREDCDRLLDDIRLRYRDFLHAVSVSIEPVEEAFNQTLAAYEKNLRAYRGRTSLKQLWQQVAENRPPAASKTTSRGRWAGTLWGLYNLLTSFGPKSTIVKASALYEELKAVEEPLLLIRQEIDTQRTSPDLENFDLFRTDYARYQDTFRGIQAFIFEEDAEPLPLPSAAVSQQAPNAKLDRWMQ